MMACEHCRETRTDARPRRTPAGDAGTLCRDCWTDVQSGILPARSAS